MIIPEAEIENPEKITPALQAKVDEWKQKAGNTIMILHAIQHEYGYVPRNISMYLANELNVPLARIYEVLTFYNYFKLEPPAENTIQVCTGTACYLKGAGKIVEEFKKLLGIKSNEAYSDDRKYKIEEVRCIGCCGLAPVLNVNDEIVGKLPVEKVNEIVNKLMQKEGIKS
jgi:NADH:ubiquinone oxidoreductase subunit E